MRHVLVSAALVVLCLIALPAGAAEDGKVSIGFFADMHRADITGQLHRPRSFFEFGGTLEVGLRQGPTPVSLRVDPTYMRKGTQHYHRGPDIALEMRTLEVPALVKVSRPIGRRVTAYGLAGLYVASRLRDANADLYVVYGLDVQGRPILGYEERTYGWARWDYGIRVGGGASVELGRGAVFAELQYGRGLRDFYAAEDLDDLTRGRHFNVGYSLRLGSKK